MQRWRLAYFSQPCEYSLPANGRELEPRTGGALFERGCRSRRHCHKPLVAELEIGTFVGILVLRLVRFEMKGRRHVTTPFSSVTDRPRPGRNRQWLHPPGAAPFLCQSPAPTTAQAASQWPRLNGSHPRRCDKASFSGRPDRTFRGGCVYAETSSLSARLCTWMRRGLACGAIGIERVRTPA